MTVNDTLRSGLSCEAVCFLVRSGAWPFHRPGLVFEGSGARAAAAPSQDGADH
jgi:hypothetical protein